MATQQVHELPSELVDAWGLAPETYIFIDGNCGLVQTTAAPTAAPTPDPTLPPKKEGFGVTEMSPEDIIKYSNAPTFHPTLAPVPTHSPTSFPTKHPTPPPTSMAQLLGSLEAAILPVEITADEIGTDHAAAAVYLASVTSKVKPSADLTKGLDADAKKAYTKAAGAVLEALEAEDHLRANEHFQERAFLRWTGEL